MGGERHALKLNRSTRAVKIDVCYTIRPFKRTPGTNVDCKSLEVWKFSDKIPVKSSETSCTSTLGASAGGQSDAPASGFRLVVPLGPPFGRRHRPTLGS